MNNKVRIKVSYSSYFYNFIISKSIEYSNLVKEKNNLYLNINYDDYNYISKFFEVKIIKYYGKRFIKNFFFINKYFILSFLICLFLLDILCNTIFNINIYCEDDKVKNDIKLFLSDNDISIYKKKKDYKYIQSIKEKILNKFDYIDWIEISEDGCNYNIDVILKRNSNLNNEYSHCDIVASKDGLIKHIVTYNGVKVKEENEYVKKGDVLISGSLNYNENNLNNEVAKGEVYAEVWYVTNVVVPLNYEEYVRSGKVFNRYYLNIFNKEFTLTGKYDSNNLFKEKECILDKPYLFFKLYKEKREEYYYKNVSLSINEAYNIGISKSDKYINDLLSEEEYIISKNVLKKEDNSSKIYLEVFYKVYENIGETLYY